MAYTTDIATRKHTPRERSATTSSKGNSTPRPCEEHKHHHPTQQPSPRPPERTDQRVPPSPSPSKGFHLPRHMSKGIRKPRLDTAHEP